MAGNSLSPRARRVSVRLFFLTILVCALYAAPSAAIMVKLTNGRYANFDPMAGAAAPSIASGFDSFFSNLDYSGGPVMPSNTDYLVVWQPSNYGSHTPFQTGYVTGMNQFFADVAHDSGLHSNSDAVATQYNDVFGNTSAYSFTNGGVLTDSDPLPANGCAVSSAHPICITDAQIQTELNSFLASKAHDLSHEYYLLTPPAVASCFDSSSTVCSGNGPTPYYCAYHTVTSAGFVYANIPDLTGLRGCDPYKTFCPSGFTCAYDNGPADGMLTAVSHEHIESITDPQPNNAWTDWQPGCTPSSPITCGGEIGDKCNNDAFSDPNLHLQTSGSTDTPYNETINGNHYLIQREWSNQGHTCLDSFTANSTVVTASFNATPASGTTVNFNAGSSTGGVAKYVWQFNDGPYPQNTTIETTSPTISHAFPATGTYTVALTVMASDGTSNGTAKNVAVGAVAPTAVFTAPTGLEGSSLTFDGSASTGSITTYTWDFGDGSTVSGAAAVVHHTYAQHGSYTAKLTVSGGGSSNSVTHTVVVTDEAPTAAFTFSPGSPTPGTAVNFDGTTSNDPDGSVASYHWAFGDGTSATGATTSHSYSAPGSYTVSLSITDSDGQTNLVSHIVKVFQAPTAAFSAPASGLEGQAVSFDGSGSSDPPANGGSLTYSWDFGDGATASGPSATVSHAFAAGSYVVTLKVTDSASGLTNSTAHTVTIADEAPTAGMSPASGRAGAPTAFAATGSDPDGTIVSFVWSFGDGGTAMGANPTHVYGKPGTYTVTVTVKDSAGLTTSVSESVTIGPPLKHGLPNCVAPKLKGKTLAQAETALKAAHCRVGKVTSPRKKPKHSAGRHRKWALVVTHQSTPPGRSEPNGTKIALKLGYVAVKTH